MGIRGKLEVEVDIKSSGDLFHELFGSRPHEISNISPEKVHTCDLHEGEFGKTGSIIGWHYTLGGKKGFVKHNVEIDEENKLLRFNTIGGDLLNDYKSIIAICHVIPKGEVTSVKWILEFEKLHDDGPYPTKELDFLIALTRDIEAHHLKV
uniref:Bet v I/Major latex protein domain-containing protein n=1 Tax=Opuntia streptacantha TaxID=393608 RepID=A0A7C8ZTL0_OPUST